MEPRMNAPDIEATTKAVRSKRRKLLLEITAYLSPVIIIIVVFVFAPLTIILFYSFLKSGVYGEIIYSFSLENFRAILAGGYGKVFLQSLYLALQTNLLFIFAGYPIAYYMAMYGGKWKTLL
ncbi:MAG: hypothetical protein QNK40_05305, partial [Desulfobacterales bacterium]|nr:hypothetical protein [Desulfobacterales bacterium]